MFTHLFDSEGTIQSYYDILPSHNSLNVVRQLGYGDEGVVMLITIDGDEYTAKVFKANKSNHEEVLHANDILEQIGVNPKLYYVGEFIPYEEPDRRQVLVIREVLPVDLSTYLRNNPDMIDNYVERCRSALTSLIDLDYFDYDFAIRNIMVDAEGELYFVDANIGSVDDDPEQVEEAMAYLDTEFDELRSVRQ